MRCVACLVALAALVGLAWAVENEPVTFGKDDEGFELLFNGKDLTGWEGDPDNWCVEDGTITGTTSAEKKLKENKFLVWKGGKLRDFELRAKFRLRNGNSGIYIRCVDRKPGKGDALVGMQADFAEDPKWVGTNMEYLAAASSQPVAKRWSLTKKASAK